MKASGRNIQRNPENRSMANRQDSHRPSLLSGSNLVWVTLFVLTVIDRFTCRVNVLFLRSKSSPVVNHT